MRPFGSAQGRLGTTTTQKFARAYRYAANGNMTGKSIIDPDTGSTEDDWTYTYQNHAVTRITTTQGGTRFQMAYDDAGNMVRQQDATKGILKQTAYDSYNRIRAVKDANDKIIGEYDYDDTGFRVRKKALRKQQGQDVVVETTSPSMYYTIEKERKQNGHALDSTCHVVNHLYLNGVRIAALTPGANALYYLTDQVDSVSTVLNDSGIIVSQVEYLPFGETWTHEGDTKHNPKYNSQELDKETNYYFYNARHYDPEICRFVTADTIIPYEIETQSWNRFSYVRNNPIIYKDPTGHEDTPLSSDGDVKAISKISNINKHVTDSFAKQNANIPTNGPDSMATLIEPMSKLLGDQVKGLADSRKRFGTVQYATDVVSKAIDSLMTRKMDEFQKSGDKRVLKLSAQEIVKESMNTMVPENQLLGKPDEYGPASYGSGNFIKGKKVSDSIEQQGPQNVDIKASGNHIKKLADAFVQGPKKLKEYYDATSGYYGQGIHEKLKLYRMDGMSAIREDQFKELVKQRKQLDALKIK